MKGNLTPRPTKNQTIVPSFDALSVKSSYSAIQQSTLGESPKTLTLQPPPIDCYQNDDSNIAIGELFPSIKTNMRIRVVNEDSRRFKDLFVPIDDESNVFEAVYEHRAVKMAHVRKWSATIVQQVKRGEAEIRCSVWDDVVESPCYSFSVDELKSTTTRQLYQLVPESDLIKLVLQCVDTSVLEYVQPLSGEGAGLVKYGTDNSRPYAGCDQKAITAGDPTPPSSLTNHQTSAQLPETDPSQPFGVWNGVKTRNDLPSSGVAPPLKMDDVSIFSSTSSRHSLSLRSPYTQEPPSEHSPAPSTKSIFRCPFSGICVDQQIFQDFESQIRRQQSHSELDMLSLDASSRRERQCTDEVSVNNASTHTHTDRSSQNETPSQRPFRPHRSDQKMAHLKSPSVMVHSNAPSIGGVSTSVELLLGASGDAWTVDSYDQEESNVTNHMSTDPKNTMRIRMLNDTSNRFKDVVVDVHSDINLFETVYEHQAVKKAHVRKWGADVVQDVKNGVAEIQCLVLDNTDGQARQTLSIEDLKKTTTKDLQGMAPKSDPVVMVLKCVKKKVSEVDVHPKSSVAFEKEVPQTMSLTKSVMMRNTRSEPYFAGEFNKSTRPNHMNLSAMSDRTFPLQRGTPPLKKSLLLTISSNKNGMLPLSSLSDQSSQMSITSTASADVIPRRKRTRSAVHKQLETALKPLSEGLPNYSPICDHHASDTTLSGTGTKPFSVSTPATRRKNNHASLPANESLDPIQLLQKYTKPARIQDMSDSQGSSFHSSRGNLNRKEMKPSRINEDEGGTPHEKQIREFIRLCRSKKGSEHQSREKVRVRRMDFETSNGARNASFPRLTREDLQTTTPLYFGPVQAPLTAIGAHEATAQGSRGTNTSKTISSTQSDRINRFLQFSDKKKVSTDDSTSDLQSFMSHQNEGEGTRIPGSIGDCSRKSCAFGKYQVEQVPGVPPMAEIAVIRGGSDIDSRSVPNQQSISMPGEVIKIVFPYHIIFDGSFRIIQVGNSLSLLTDGCSLVGQCVSDIFQITGPIPSLGKWEWSLLEKMKDNTVFLESFSSNSSNQKAKVKGSIIEVSENPPLMMLALFPNVKNLSELEDMNLSMADLPLHSCQREAVLLGEHSKSEVKLTNHLDQLHRDLINSMEKQIEDRTTELATANQELEDANNQLARQSARQLEHFACMSHEIRTPLNCIVGMSSLLLEDCEETEMDPLHVDSIKMIHTSGELLKAVVDDVLDYAKLESGAFLVDIKPTLLQNTLDSVVHSISRKLQEKDIRLRTHYSPTLPEMLETDSRRLQQVLFNLLGNAGKFSNRGSVIDLGVKVIQANEVEGSSHGQNARNRIRFSVKDYGKGIDSKDFEKIFKPFSQASKETQNIYGGTGLGLSITSKLVKRLGGTISVDSELDRFAEFTVDLPLSSNLLVNVQEVSELLEGTEILLVENEQSFDYSFTSYPLQGESHPFSTDVAQVYGLNVHRCHNLDVAYDYLSASAESSPSNHYAVVIHETLFEQDINDKLIELVGNNRFTVMTHGPKYLVENTKKRHFKSLSGIFPVTLLCSIASQIAESTSDSSFAPALNSAEGIAPASTIAPLARYSSQSSQSAHIADAATLDSSTRNHDESPEPEKLPRKYDLKVLYAEDNLVNQKVLSRVLNRAGITDITIVDDGKKAVDLSATTHFDCIFMDMQMPIMDGMEATKIIMNRDPTAKVIFVTAHALDEFKSRAGSVGATSFISKPFRISDIEKVLEETGICIPMKDNPSPNWFVSSSTKSNAVDLVAGTTSKTEFDPLVDSDPAEKRVKSLFAMLGDNDEVSTPEPKVLMKKPIVSSEMPLVTTLLKSPAPNAHLFTTIQPSVVEPDLAKMLNASSACLPPPLPAASPSTPSAISKRTSLRSKKEALPRNLKVLYAEDNEINQKVLTRVLNRTGITDITIVDNGKKAVDITENAEFDCIFMDMQMPIMDGMEAARLIMERNPKTKIVFVTAHAMEEYKTQAQALGARGFLAKPVRVTDFEAVLAELGL